MEDAAHRGEAHKVRHTSLRHRAAGHGLRLTMVATRPLRAHSKCQKVLRTAAWLPAVGSEG